MSFGPALVFAGTYLLAPVAEEQRIFAATGALMAATLARLIVAPRMDDVLASHMLHIPWLSTTLIMLLGGVALWLNDEMLIKIGPTIYFALVGASSIWSVLAGRPRLQRFVRRPHLRAIDREGWRKLTIYAGCACALMAILNEVIWRNASTGFWVVFQLVGWMLIELLFMALVYPMLRRHDFGPKGTAQHQGTAQ